MTNSDAKSLNKLFANQVQEHIKNINHHNEVSFLPDAKIVCPIHIKMHNSSHKWSKGKNSIIIYNNLYFDKIQGYGTEGK